MGNIAKTKNFDRRSFLKVSALAGGGMMLSFSWLAGCTSKAEETAALNLPKEWFELNSYIKIGENGAVTLFNSTPEFGQNVKTSLPMILAEELDVDWNMVMVEQANFSPRRFERQFIGGSQSIRQGWIPLRTVGATARQMLVNAAAQTWKVSTDKITTENGILMHKASGKKAGYGEMVSLAAKLPVPEDIKLKETQDFKIIGSSKRNVDLEKIITGKPLFGIDYKMEGMKYASIIHPPAFGMKLKSFDAATALTMPGIKEVFAINIFNKSFVRSFFDTATHPELIAVVGNSTWEVLQAKKSVKVEWENAPESTFSKTGFGGGNPFQVTIPEGLESTDVHRTKMAEFSKKPGKLLRMDGDPEAAFKKAAKVLERTYTAPFLAHNTMEPANCFAHVTADHAEIYGATQWPDPISATLSDSLGLPKDKIQINLARMGGGFGRRGYSHQMVEAALISHKANAPIMMVYTREDDMTSGVYRPTYSATYRAAIDENGKLTAIHIKAGGIPETPIAPNRFPAGAVDNYLAEGWDIPSNITVGAFRAPSSNFIAGAEQSFLDELAEEMDKDPIDFRLELLDRARNNPVGKNNDYDPKRYAGVLELVRDKSNWNATGARKNRGVAAYFCHNTYVAEVVELEIKEDTPVIPKVYAAVDCGIVVNLDAARNMGEGGIVDGIGNALFGELTFKDGVPEKNNFDTYRMIRQQEAPKSIDIHFVENNEDPTGLGEPLFPPVFAAVANALYKATGKRFYDQPFSKDIKASEVIG